MINFHNQQIRNEIAPEFNPEIGTDYTGRMRDLKEASVAGYDIKPFEYADAELTGEAEKVLDGGFSPPTVFREYYMGTYPSTHKYDFLRLSKHFGMATNYAESYRIGQVINWNGHVNVCTSNMLTHERNQYKRIWHYIETLTEKDKELKPLSPADIPIEEGMLFLCVKNADRPWIEIPNSYLEDTLGEKIPDYDDTDYIFLYRENGQTYTQKKNHKKNINGYQEKPAMPDAYGKLWGFND